MEKKPFKDTNFGKLLEQKLPEAAQIVGEILPDTGALGIVKNLIQKAPSLTTVDKTALLEQARQFEENEMNAYLKDGEDARDMQKVALSQTDLFSKRFVYYFAATFMLLTFAYLFTVSFYVVPEENRMTVNTATPLLLSAGFGTVMGFFFGSSKCSREKDEAIMSVLKGIGKM